MSKNSYINGPQLEKGRYKDTLKRSIIDLWHGFGRFTAEVSHDGDTGNAALTVLEIVLGNSDSGFQIAKDRDGGVKALSLELSGSCERSGLADLFRAIADELDKPIALLGNRIRLGYEDDVYDENGNLTISVKGAMGESRLNEWLQTAGLSYLYVNQSREAFSRMFRGTVKRPDFLVLLESIGLIAVDAKNYAPYQGGYTLPLETELRRVLTFERLFRIPVWYAYLSEEVGEPTVWYWISALKAIEVGQIQKNSKTGEDFVAIKLEHFERVESNSDLGKLYTHRLPSTNRLHRF